MDKITKEEFEKAPARKGQSRILTNALETLEIEEGLLLKKEEWVAKSKPQNVVGQTFREPRSTKKFKVKTLTGGEGWVFLRIK